MKNFTIV